MPKLSITSPISIEEDGGKIYDQFGNLTLTNLPRESIVEMWKKIFGTGSVGSRRLTDFDGHGQPRASSTTPQQISCSGGTVTVRLRAEITDMGGLDCTYRFYWDTNATFSNNPQYTDIPANADTEPAASGDGVIVTHDVQVSMGDDVYAVPEVWNAFNDGYNSDSDNDFYQEPLGSASSLTTTKSALATPSIITKGTDDLDVYLEFSHDSNSTDAQYEYRVNGGTAKTPDSINCEQDLGTATAEVNFRMDGFLNPGDTLEARVRASGNACYNASAWSSWTSVGRPEDYKSCANF